MQSDEAAELSGDDTIGFGSFQLNRRKRLLIKDGTPISIGNRAMDILLVLTEKPGAIVNHRELLRRVWPNTAVEIGSIRVQVAYLRKALRESGAQSDYVHNVTGHGYRFVAQVIRYRRAIESPVVHPQGSTVVRLPLRVPSRRNNLPHLLFSVVGRDETIRDLSDCVAKKRFVTVTGRGGTGKSTVAVAAAESLAAAYANGVCFLDIAAMREPQELWTALSTALDVSVSGADPLHELLSFLSRHSMLMVVDNCEHMIDTVAQLVESVLRRCPQVSILVTSRESLRASRETIYELMPLALPATSDHPSSKQSLEYPAIQLFIERAAAYAGRQLNDEELSLVADVCQRGAGNPLALDIAAGQVRWLGMRVLSTGLHGAMYLSIEGRRTAAQRHRTLRASFDWSYSLLSQMEQAVFRRLSVFAGGFTLEHAVAVVADDRLTHGTVFECLISLARKSLITTSAAIHEPVYRLDDLSNVYASEKLHEAQELQFIHRRHAQMWRRVEAEQISAHARLWRPNDA